MASKKEQKSGKTSKGNAQVETSKFNVAKAKQFATDVKNEFGKVAWPDKKHTIATTGVVVVLVFMVSCYLGTVDLILGKLIGLLIN